MYRASVGKGVHGYPIQGFEDVVCADRLKTKTFATAIYNETKEENLCNG